MENGGWYMNTPQGPTGPLTEQQLKEYAENGHVLATTHVWREGLPQWDEVAAVPLLRRVLAAATARERRAKAEAAAAATAPAAGPTANRAATPDELEFEDDDGTVYEWDRALGKYRPKEDNKSADPATKAIAERAAAAAAKAAAAGAASAVQPPTYDPADMTYVPEAVAENDKPSGPKRRAGPTTDDGASDGNGNGSKRARPSAAATTQPAPQPQQQQQPHQQQLSATSVYVTGLPEDATEAEVAAAFSRCGVLRLSPDGRPRIRLYLDKSTGRPKGDALVCYLKPPSVALAVQILDGAPLRPGKSDLPMSVSVARFEAAAAGEAAAMGGAAGAKPHSSSSAVAGVASAAAARQRRKERERQEKRLLGWEGHDDTAAPASRTTVVLAPMFSREEVERDRSLPALVEEDVRSECSRRGLRLVRCVAFGRHPRGVVTARFATPEDADACVAAMQGRFYGGRQVEAALWDGVTNYRAQEEQGEEEEAGEGEGLGEEAVGRSRSRSAGLEEEEEERGKDAEEEGGGGAQVDDDDEDDEDARLDAFFAGGGD